MHSFAAVLHYINPFDTALLATDGLYHERNMVFRVFGYGLVLTIGSVVMVVWLHLHWEASLVCCLISLYTIMMMKQTHTRLVKKVRRKMVY